eukprot:TRINITY_DN30309_c1_g1_i1.p1 TRINITY_DN30309_c1_g1~~TRINITY_DN30309_c1_g1_i1.p1  ORF type:complete len:148 (+),score=20.55 TRINITY_DN30309_c1_g1_i1:63-506(+)
MRIVHPSSNENPGLATEVSSKPFSLLSTSSVLSSTQQQLTTSPGDPMAIFFPSFFFLLLLGATGSHDIPAVCSCSLSLSLWELHCQNVIPICYCVSLMKLGYYTENSRRHLSNRQWKNELNFAHIFMVSKIQWTAPSQIGWCKNCAL